MSAERRKDETVIDISTNYRRRRGIVLTIGTFLYVLSFFLTGVWDSKPPADPIPGWYCAGFALRATLLRSGWLSNSWIFLGAGASSRSCEALCW